MVSNLKPGKHQVTFDNSSKEIHLIAAAPIRGSATIADVKKALSKRTGPPPVELSGFTGTAVSRRQGKPHFREGLLKEVDVR